MMSQDSEYDEQRERTAPGLMRALHHCADWMLSGHERQPAEIQERLLRQSLTKRKTLLLGLLSTSLGATVAVAMTQAFWAYAWLAAELMIGCVRLWISGPIERLRFSEGKNNAAFRVLLGLTAFMVLSAGFYQCVHSGQWPLIAMSGIGVASMMGAVASRNAATPRYALMLIGIVTVPYWIAVLASPLPFMFIIGIQVPLYASGVIFVMLENHKVLLNLYLSERENLRLSQHDLLTSLPNRSMQLKRLEELLTDLRAHPNDTQLGFTVFCLDLDGFKNVNDRFGHAAGDALLITMANRLRSSVRPCDFVSRIGGDEFVVLLPAISPGDAVTIAERIIADIGLSFDIGLPTPVRVGISIGSADAPVDGETVDALMRSADLAMYEAKRLGKGVFVSARSLADHVELAPADSVGVQPMKYGQASSGKNRRFPLLSHPKSV